MKNPLMKMMGFAIFLAVCFVGYGVDINPYIMGGLAGIFIGILILVPRMVK